MDTTHQRSSIYGTLETMQAVKVVTSPTLDWLHWSTNQIDSDYYNLFIKYTISWRRLLYRCRILQAQLRRLSVFRKSHVASFQGRVVCRICPLEGLINKISCSRNQRSRIFRLHTSTSSKPFTEQQSILQYLCIIVGNGKQFKINVQRWRKRFNNFTVLPCYAFV